jgi:hypothetical protein
MDAVTRLWSESVARLADHVSGGVPTLFFLTALAAVLVALGWHFWPSWLPWNWRWHGSKRRRRDRRTRRWWRFRLGRLRWRLPRWRLPRWRLRRRRRKLTTVATELAELPPDALPELSAELLTLTADQFAAAGRYAEAVRERLRATVRGLIERDVLQPSPGWTVTELARGAAVARPPLAAPLAEAVAVFSEIWYGMRSATAADDDAMRGHADAVAGVLAEPATAPAAVGGTR